MAINKVMLDAQHLLDVIDSEEGIKKLAKSASLKEFAETVEEWKETASYVLPAVNRLILQRLDERVCSDCQDDAFELT